MRVVCYAAKTDFEAYIQRQTDTQVVFTVGGCNGVLAASLVAKHDPLYFHLETRRDEVRNVVVDTYHREEFRGCRARELRQTVEPQERHLLGGGSGGRAPSRAATCSDSFRDLMPERSTGYHHSGRVSYLAEGRESSWATTCSDAFRNLMPERSTGYGFEVSYRACGVWNRSEADLLRICHGNKAQFERLVAHAQHRNPTISREEAIEHAVYWYHRDNR